MDGLENDLDDQLREYLQSVASLRRPIRPTDAYSSIEALLLKEGVSYTPQPLPSAYEPGPIRHCFQNAALLAIGNPELTYCEGYAYHLLPTQHAWCVLPDGSVADPTWRWGTEQCPCDEGALLGVSIPTKALMSVLVRKGTYGVLDDWINDWPILSKPFDASDLASLYPKSGKKPHERSRSAQRKAAK